MRRLLAALAVVLVVAACGDSTTLPRLDADGAPSDHGILRVPDPSGISLLDTVAGRVTTRVPDGVRSRDWVFQSRITAAGTQLVAVSPLGDVGWHRDLDDDLTARLASSDGSRVALVPRSYQTTDPYHPVGRSITDLTVVATDGGEPRQYRLDGNFEPEAFTTSGRALFVVEYLPAMQPDRYRVRKLDLDTGEVGAVFSVDGHLQESMRGTARVAAMSADGSRLYTLYTTEQSAFVHVLDLDEEWAHCVDLPAPIGSSPEGALAVAADPNGGRVLVVDAGAGVAELDTRQLAITHTMPWFDTSPESGVAMAVVDRVGRLVAGRGNHLTTFDTDLDPLEERYTPTRMLGLHLDPRRDAVWVLGQRAMFEVDPVTGSVEDTVPLPEAMPVLQVPDAPGFAPIQCAC